ncbi:hypothetical protein G6O67_003236 [Ophiocordyceps sinensis]|uniref:Uncharacterized protein n=1 Tax=Ophiocordyceps sinensis TaxID=72228 RepID=A0A8H4PVV1_9HYPO|nr:hypothetical protein G6O67_003236 [Ophiocordyceps sinensis]
MANPARIVSNLEAEVNTLAGNNMVGQMTYWLRAMGLTHQQSDALGLPDWKLAGCPWPFESQLMSEIILTAEAGRVPETTDLMMLTLCSSTGPCGTWFGGGPRWCSRSRPPR